MSELSKKHLEIARYEWGNDRQEIAISALESARYMSDAHIDILTLGTKFNIKEGYAANEFIGDECRCERNEYMTQVADGNAKVSNAIEASVFTDNDSFFSFTSINKCENEISEHGKLIEIVNKKIDELEAIDTITDAKTLIKNFKTERESHLITKRLQKYIKQRETIEALGRATLGCMCEAQC